MTPTMTQSLPELPCRDIVEVVTAYLEGYLEEDLHERFEYHLTTCAKCVDYVEQMRRTIDITGHALEPEQLAADIRDGLRSAFADWSRAGSDKPAPPAT
jgi:anti-sigma factor RsiW